MVSVIVNTDLLSWNACILQALALPALPRLGVCPDELLIRDQLSPVPVFDEKLYYSSSTPGGGSSPDGGGGDGGGDGSIPGEGDTSHLTRQMTRSEVLHFSRRVGYSPKSLGLDAYILPGAAAPEGNTSTYETNLTLQDAISMAISAENLALNTTGRPKVYWNYKERILANGLALWSQERRVKRNNWDDLLRLPYPRHDPIERRLQRWQIEEYFDMNTLVVPSDELLGSIELKASSIGLENEILQKIHERVTIFFYPLPISKDHDHDQKLDAFTRRESMLDGAYNLKDPNAVDWYRTIMFQPDVKETTSITVSKVIDDWKCDKATNKHPDDPTIDCDASCDLRDHLIIDYHAETAMLKDRSWNGKDGTMYTASWYVLKECVKPDPARKFMEQRFRHPVMNLFIGRDLRDLYFQDALSPANGLRARMTFFFRNIYATPEANVDDWLLMYGQYETIWTHALGNYRTLALKMFNDAALRKSLDQLQEVECGTAPIENFAREWFERFTVGLRAHNEGDIKRLAKGLMNCVEDAETFNPDLTKPGIIFSDVNQTLWTLTENEQASVVNAILDFSMRASEPPAAAQFLCSRLYSEFALHPQSDPARQSSIGMPPAVVACARHLYDHNYDITFALEHILHDRQHFSETLGHKKRWPLALMLGTMMDFDLYKPGWECWNCQSAQWANAAANKLGMMPFSPPDVAGWDLESIWVATHLTAAHDFLEEQIVARATEETTDADFTEPASMQRALAPYNLGPVAPTKYAFSARLCGPDFYVDETGQEGQHMIDVDTMFDGTEAETVGTEWKVFGHSIDQWQISWLSGDLDASPREMMQMRMVCFDDVTKSTCDEGEGYSMALRKQVWQSGKMVFSEWVYHDFTGAVLVDITVTLETATKVRSAMCLGFRV